MPRRYYRDDDEAAAQFAAWAVGFTVAGLAKLVQNLIPPPNAYNPIAPDNPEHIHPLIEKVGQIKLNPPDLDTSKLKLPKNLWDTKEWKAAFGSAGTVRVKPPEGGKAIIERKEDRYPFLYPSPTDPPRAVRIHAAKEDAVPVQSIDLISALTAACPTLTYEIIGNGLETVWQVADYEGRYPPQILAEHIRTYFPQAVVEIIDPNDVPERQYPYHRQLLVFGLTNEYPAPLPMHGEKSERDPLVALTRRMDFLDPGQAERVHYQVITFVRSYEAANRALDRLVRGAVKPTMGIIEDRNDPLYGFDIKVLNAKARSPLYHTFIALTLESRDSQRLDQLAQSARDLFNIRRPGYNGLTLVGPPNLKRSIDTVEQGSVAWFETMLTLMVQTRKVEWRQLLSVLSAQEIAALWHLPDETFSGEKIAWATPNAPDDLLAEGADRVVLGTVQRGGKARPVSLSTSDRAHHHYVAGKTGTGKSTLLHTLIHQDIAAGRGVAVIDPHGELIDHVLATSIPPERHGDVVLLDCGQTDFPVPLNPFRVPEGVGYQSAFNHVYWVLRRIYADIWLEGRTDMVMRNVVEALLCDPEATPLDIRRLFTSDDYREHVIALMEDHDHVSMETLYYWQDFGDRAKGDRRDIADPVITRTRAFLGNRALELMTCHRHGLDYRRFIEQKQIVLARLSGSAITQEAGSLGATLISGLFLAAEALSYTRVANDPRLFVYIDEVERFVTTPLTDMLAQARKFGLALTLANQYLDQLSKETYSAVVGTVGTLSLFELGMEDAHKLKSIVEPDVPADKLTTLGLHRMAVKTRANGKSIPAFVTETRPAPTGSGPAFQPAPVTGLTGDEIRDWLKTRRERRTGKGTDDGANAAATNAVQEYE